MRDSDNVRNYADGFAMGSRDRKLGLRAVPGTWATLAYAEGYRDGWDFTTIDSIARKRHARKNGS